MASIVSAAVLGGGAEGGVGAQGRLREGREVQVDPIKLMLKPPGTKPLKLKCDDPHSKSAFKFNLRRYTKDKAKFEKEVADLQAAHKKDANAARARQGGAG